MLQFATTISSFVSSMKNVRNNSFTNEAFQLPKMGLSLAHLSTRDFRRRYVYKI